MALHSRAAALGILFLLQACLPPVTVGALPFSTIEQKSDPAYIGQQQYTALDPEVMVFWDREQAEAADYWFSESARRELARVDWGRLFVVAVFQGWQGSGGYGVEVTEVAVEGAVIRVKAAFDEPGGAGAGGVTSPYHLVVVRRPVADADFSNVELVVGQQVVVRTTSDAP